MAWTAPYLPDCPPWYNQKQQKEWWESNRKIYNDYAEKFNNDRLNKIWFWLGKVHPIAPMPSFEDVMAKYKAQK